MPDFHRYRVPGGCYFFTVNLLERRCNTMLTDRIDLLRDAVRRVGRTRPFSIDAWIVLPDHLHAVWPAARRRRFLDPLAADQDLLRPRPAQGGAVVAGPKGRWRTRHLAAPLLGARHPQRRGLRGAHGLRPFQPSQARPRRLAGRLAVFHVPILRLARTLPARLDWRCGEGDRGRRTRQLKTCVGLRLRLIRPTSYGLT